MLDTVAYVTVKFRVPYVGLDEEDLGIFGSFEEFVKDVIEDEGIFNIADDEFEIISIEKAFEEDCDESE